jgi:hypothetical protein
MERKAAVLFLRVVGPERAERASLLEPQEHNVCQ